MLDPGFGMAFTRGTGTREVTGGWEYVTGGAARPVDRKTKHVNTEPASNVTRRILLFFICTVISSTSWPSILREDKRGQAALHFQWSTADAQLSVG